MSRRLNNVRNIPSDLVVKFGDINVKNGALLRLSQVESVPSFSYNLDRNKYYMLVIVDPDAPAGFYIHLCRYNMTSSSGGVLYYKYKPPSPPAGSGPNGDGEHRYYCILYEQGGRVGRLGEGERVFKDYMDFRCLFGDLRPVVYKYFRCKNGLI